MCKILTCRRSILSFGQTLLMYSILVRCDWCSASSSSVVRLPSLCSDRIRSSSSVMRRKFSVGASLPEEAILSSV